MKTIEIKNLLDEVEVLQASIRTSLKSVEDDEDDNEKEVRELKEKVEELEEETEYLREEVEEMKETEKEYTKEAEENTTQLFLFAEFLRCSDQELIFAKFVADLEEFGDVALNFTIKADSFDMPDSFSEVA